MIFNLEVEQSVIGCIILGKKELLPRLKEEDFSQQTFKKILEVCKKLDRQNKSIDPLTVSQELQFNNSFEMLISIADKVPTVQNAESYMAVLKEYSFYRSMEKAGHYIIDRVQKMDDVKSCKADIMKAVDISILEQTKKAAFVDLLNDALEDMENNINEDNRLNTGFYELDKFTAGLHPEEMTIIAARPGIGKTAFVLNLIANLCGKGVNCLLISREMSGVQLTKRIISKIAPIDGHKLRYCKLMTDKEWKVIGDTCRELNEWPLIINDELATVEEIRAYARELKQKGQLDMLAVDYLTLCRSALKHEGRRQEVEHISRQFKEIAMELQIPVVVLSQLSREAAKAGEPELHHLRETGAVEQDADNVIFLHVPKDTDENAVIFDIKVILAKQRNGPTGFITLGYNKKTFTFMNKER